MEGEEERTKSCGRSLAVRPSRGFEVPARICGISQRVAGAVNGQDF